MDKILRFLEKFGKLKQSLLQSLLQPEVLILTAEINELRLNTEAYSAVEVGA